MDHKAFQQAMQKISENRTRAKIENELHYKEVNQKIKDFGIINKQLSNIAIRILNGENIENLKKQNLQAQEMCRKLLLENGFPADYLEIHYTCEKCQDTGYNGNEYCSCLRKLITEISTERLNQESQLKLCSFKQFNMEYYRNQKTKNCDDCYKVMEKILNKCKKYATNFQPHSESLLFMGDVGVGKTHLSLSIVSEVIKQNYGVIYDSVGSLLSKIEEEHFKTSKTETQNSDTLQLVLNTDLLVLDDLGTEFLTSFTLSVIYTIINTRINRNLPTIISTNLTPDDIREKYEPRLKSRLLACYRCLQLEGPDIRAIKRKNI